MTLPELLQALDTLGASLSLRLVVQVPRGLMTDELKAALIAHKPWLLDRLGRSALLEELSRQQGGPPAKDPDHRKAPLLAADSLDIHAPAEREAVQGENQRGEHSGPNPLPERVELIDPRDRDPRSTPPRPLRSPTWGVTKSIRVVKLASWSPSRQAKDPVIKVTAEGWNQWFPVEPGDLPPTKEGIAAEASQNLFDWEAIQTETLIDVTPD
ncbi:MAG: hypothetical protein ACLQU5_19630 [Isosphaeraceae bacterium]